MHIQGYATIQRAIINIKEKDDIKGKKGDKELLVEGYGLQRCMVTEGAISVVFYMNRYSLNLQVLSENARRQIMLLRLPKYWALRQPGEPLSMKFSTPCKAMT